MINRRFNGAFGSAMNTAMQNNNTLPGSGLSGSLTSDLVNNAMNQGITGGVRPATFNPAIKASGAPVNFSPKSISTMNSAFGMPIQNSFDRAMMQDPNLPDMQQDPNICQ